jgi:hypothetical protein
LSGVLTVSANSSSVLYYGNWLKVDEPIPSTVSTGGATGATATVVQTNTNQPTSATAFLGSAALPVAIGNNILNTQPQTGGGTASTGFAFASSNGVEVTRPSNSASSGQKLSTTELKSAISLAVKSMLSEGITVQYIINYFLNVQSPGYKLYVGITKKIFTDAVKGIFTDADLTILNNYGNTNAGQTNGGSASNKGSNVSQTGGDSGTSRSRPPANQE